MHIQVEEDKELQEELEIEAMYRLIDGILLNVLDMISISRKWDHRKIGLSTLHKKKSLLIEFREYFKTVGWSTWLGIYCEYFVKNKYSMKKRFENIRLTSMKEVNRRLREYEKM